MKNKNTRILVTGGAGFIGSHVVKELIKQDYDVWVVDWDMKPWAVKNVPKEKQLPFDFSDDRMAGIMNSVPFDAVIHLAAYHVVPESMEKPRQYYLNNVIATDTLLSWCLAYGIKHFVYSGSSSVYGDNGMTMMEGEPRPTALKETADINPQSPYASTKAIAEMMLKDYSLYGNFSYTSLRYFNAAGADPNGELGYVQQPATHIIPALVEKIHTEQQLKIYGNDYPTPDGTCVRDYTHVQDLAVAHIKALEYLLKGGDSEIINLGGGVGTSLLELMEVSDKTINKKVNWEYADRRPGDPPYLMADISKAKTLLEWEPKHKLEDIIKHAYNWQINKRIIIHGVTS